MRDWEFTRDKTLNEVVETLEELNTTKITGVLISDDKVKFEFE